MSYGDIAIQHGYRPCIIVQPPSRPLSAWNEDGRMIATASALADDPHTALAQECWRIGYVPVSLNSRLGRTITDKIVQGYVT